MAVVKDPEGNETSTLHSLVHFKDLSVLEVGCGDGRLTWRYAGEVAQVTAIDPDETEIAKARAGMPAVLQGRVSFAAASIEDFSKSYSGPAFDLALFSWSL